MALHWEHGYRCHGLWDETGKRHGLVSIGPSRMWTPEHGWHWVIDGCDLGGTETNLRAAKRKVEAHWKVSLTR